MDMFYGATEGVIKHRRRFHFHEVNSLLFTNTNGCSVIQL
jgi:hypothetical protein